MSRETPTPEGRRTAGPITRWLSGRSTRSARPPSPADIEGFRRAQSVGAKFEELLVVEPDRAYWLDDTSQRRMTVGV